jgi:hypothetical protein
MVVKSVVNSKDAIIDATRSAALGATFNGGANANAEAVKRITDNDMRPLRNSVRFISGRAVTGISSLFAPLVTPFTSLRLTCPLLRKHAHHCCRSGSMFRPSEANILSNQW